ncbi:MAG: ATP-binding protein, partial [Bacteroidota bacterium]
IEEGIYVPLHTALADLLLTNLVSNAIRHNIPHGTIRVKLSKAGLVISNTGKPPEVPTGELFERFKKGNPGSDSIGIGLAIVRQICDIMNFDIVYEYISGRHILAISFLSSHPASKLLQNLEVTLSSTLQP